MIDWLQGIGSEVNDGETVYSITDAKLKFEVVQLSRNGWLVLNWDENKLILDFAVLSFSYSEFDGKQEMGACVFHGSGPSGALRECRHTWWGDDNGYVFYPPGDVITAAFKELSKYFDDLT